MSWIALLNPHAGAKSVDPDEVNHALEQAGIDFDLEVVQTVADMRAAAVEVARSEHDLVVVGGDGTVGLVADALLAKPLPRLPKVGIIPAGSGCDLLRTFGVSRDMAEAAVRLNGEGTYRIDVGVLSGDWGDRHFVNVAQAGAGGAAAETAPKMPRRLGAARYPLAFASRLPRFPRTQVRIGGSMEMTSDALAVIVANGQFFAGGWNVAPKALLVDGAFDVQVVDAKKRDAPRLVPKLMAGTHLREKEVIRRSLEHVTLETAVPWPVEADGDYLGTTPFEARVLPGALELKV
jgi:YegS/Rv2252/BmrU family lipid kinase